MQGRLDRVAKKIAGDFKNTRPFDQTPVSTDEQIYNYNTQGYDTFKQIAQTQGLDAAVLWQKDMEQKIQKRGIK